MRNDHRVGANRPARRYCTVPQPPGDRVGAAIGWRGVQLGAVQGLAALRLLVLARLLSPDDFGLVAIAFTCVGLAASLSDPGIVPALVQRSDPGPDEYHAGWTLGMLRGLALAALLASLAAPLAALFAEPRAAAVLRVLALLPLVGAAASIGTARLTRDLDFRALTVLRTADAAVNTVVAIALAAVVGVWALVAGALAGAAAATVCSYALAPYRPRIVLRRDALRPLLAFGRWIVATTLLATLTDFVLRAIIARRLGAGALGIYYLAAGLVFLPVGAAAEVLGAVALPTYARLAADLPTLRRTFRTLAAGLGVALVPVYAVLAGLAGGLAADVLGPVWLGAAPVLRLLSIACVVGLVGEAAVPLFQGVGRPRLVVLLEIATLVGVAVLALPLAGAYGLTGAALAWLGAAALSLAVCVRLLNGVVNRPFRDQGARVASILGAGVVAGAAAFTSWAALTGLVGVLVGAAGGLVAGAVAMRGFDRWLRLGMLAEIGGMLPRLGSAR